MLANYHTHTWRCGHAEGEIGDYVAEAVKAGLKTLGFSDHTPYDFFDIGPRNRPMRMTPRELPGYVAAIRRESAARAGEITLLAGVEAEYYPKYFPRLLELLREAGVDYLILGQHFLGNEVGEPYCGTATEDAARLERYVNQCCEGLETGVFSYLAHPDLLHFAGDEALYRREMRRLCQAAKKTGTPLELNLLGLRSGRHYPNEVFWELAAEEGNTVILGTDAHRPADVSDPASEEKAHALLTRLGLPLIDALPETKWKQPQF